MTFDSRAYATLDAELGIVSRRVDIAEQLTRTLDHAIADPDPHLIGVVIPLSRGSRPRPTMRRRLEVK